MMRFVFTATVLAMLGNPALAQGRGRNTDGVPPGQRPPSGMCRIWIDGVPPGHQPAPTDCRTAVRNRPANGRVIYGDDARYASSDRYGNGKGKYKDKNAGDWKRNGRDDDDRYDRDDVCFDRNHDGRCDADRNAGYCVDGNRDGRCDDVYSRSRNGQSLPTMVRDILIDRGQRSDDQRRWLGDANVTGHYADADRNGVPERITWMDAAGRVVQVWLDDNRDGRADIVRLYNAGELVRVVQR
jgi:hypothetical protein